MSKWLFLQRHKPVVLPETSTTENAYGAVLGIDMEKGTTAIEERIRKEYRLHTAQYWFVATLANGLLWLQIVIGAALTALGASGTRQSQKAVIYLGAANTITAGLLTYFKSRNQPNRACQLRNALRTVRNNMDDQSRELSGLTPDQAREKARDIIEQYNNALATAASNYPDLWATIGDLSKFLPSKDLVGGKGSTHSGANQSAVGQKPNDHGTEATSQTKPSQQPESHKGSSETQVEPGHGQPAVNQPGTGQKPNEHGTNTTSSPPKPPAQPEHHKSSSETQVESDGGIPPQSGSTTSHPPAAGPKPGEHNTNAPSSAAKPPQQPESHKGSSNTQVESGGNSQRDSSTPRSPATAPVTAQAPAPAQAQPQA